MPPGTVSALSTLTQTNGANPAANAEWTAQVVPASKYWQLVSVSVSLVQGITQTPQPILVIDDGTDVVYESFGSSAAQAVSTTCRYTWAPGLTLTGQAGATTNVHSTAPLPEGLILGPGYRLTSLTVGIGANTDYAAPSFLYIEYG